jgi:hypothetical protein
MKTIKAIIASKAKYEPKSRVRKDRIVVGSSASKTDEPINHEARVKNIEPKTPMNQVSAEIFRRLRSFSADVESLPSTSSSKNAIANRTPIVANPPSKFKHLKAVLKKFIDC